jgi:uncharacterized protein YkwD
MSRPSVHPSLIWLLVAIIGCSSPAGPTPAEAGAAGASAETLELASLTNTERARAGLPGFTVNPSLMRGAQIHAEQMVATGQMAHQLSGVRYPQPQDRLAAVGYQWQAYAENVAYGQGSPASALTAWMGSSGHRANILNAGLTEIGTGIARDAAGRPYYVQLFGHPR